MQIATMAVSGNRLVAAIVSDRRARLLKSWQQGVNARREGAVHGANPYMASPIFKLPFESAAEELQLDLVEAWWDGWDAGGAEVAVPLRDAVSDRLHRLELDLVQNSSLDMDTTIPSPSRWAQDGAEYVRSNDEWLARCAAAMVKLRSELNPDQAFAVAREFSLDDDMRALSPERAAGSIVAP